MNLKLVGELIGIISIIVSFFIYLSNSRKKILVFKGITDALWALNSLFIGAFTGFVINIIMIFREYVFYHRMSKKWAQHKVWLYFFCAVCFASPMIEIIKTGEFMLVPFFPAIGSITAVFGFYDTNPKRIRLLNFVATMPWFAYAIYTNNITLSLSSVITVGSILSGVLLSHKSKKKD